MGIIPANTVEEIFNRARIEEVVGDFLTLKKRGVNMLGLCPFHNEKTPSFTVSPVKNIFKCFGCGRSGTPVGFIMEYENISYPDALKYLAHKYNIEIQEKDFSPEEKVELQRKESLYLVNDFAATHFQQNLTDSDYGKAAGLSYFKSRGFTEETIKRFRLGFAFPNGNDLYSDALKKGYKAEYLEELGLVNASHKDFFVNRVMFPVFNLSGRVIGFGGRALTISDKTPKYLNSPESEVYHKSKILYGFFQAKTAIKKANNCYLVEGYTDVLALHQAGIELGVASSGTSLTPDQARLIARFSENVTLLFDGDAAGIKAAERNVDILLAENLNVEIVILPDAADPDSYLQAHGAQKLTDFVAHNKKDFILFKAEEILNESRQDPIKKIALLRDLIQSVSLVPEALKRSVYANAISKLLQVDEFVLATDINKKVRENLEKEKLGHIRDRRAEPISEKPTASQKDVELKDVAYLNELFHDLLFHGDKMYNEDDGVSVKDKIIQELTSNQYYINHPMYQALLQEYIANETSGDLNDIQYYQNHADPEVRKLLMTWIDPGYEYSKNWLEKHHMPLQYQPMPEHNYIRNIDNALLLFYRNIYDNLNKENREKMQLLSAEDSIHLLEKQLKTQMLIDTKRSEIYEKLGLVVNRWVDL